MSETEKVTLSTESYIIIGVHASRPRHGSPLQLFDEALREGKRLPGGCFEATELPQGYSRSINGVKSHARNTHRTVEVAFRKRRFFRFFSLKTI